MPGVVEHLRADPKSHPNNRSWLAIEHVWTLDLYLSLSHLVEEDGGPKCPHGTGYGIYAGRYLVDHTFTNDYPTPDGIGIRKGDRVRFWRER